jgi:hypothetical protein
MDILDVLKWVGIVFAAGFIGYFGRYLGKIIIARLHKRESEGLPLAQPAKETTSELNHEIEKDKLKLEKKKMKLEKKKQKELENQEGKRD